MRRKYDFDELYEFENLPRWRVQIERAVHPRGAMWLEVNCSLERSMQKTQAIDQSEFRRIKRLLNRKTLPAQT